MSEIQPGHERSIPANIFLSPDEPRLRTGWRLLIQTILFFVLQTVFFFVLLLFGPIDLSTRSILLQIYDEAARVEIWGIQGISLPGNKPGA